MNDPTPVITEFLKDPQVVKVFEILNHNPEAIIRAWEDYRLKQVPPEKPSDVKVIPPQMLEEYWRDIYVHGMSAEDVNNELSDFRMVMNNYQEVMGYVTGDRVSKLNTDASVVCSLADEQYETWYDMCRVEDLELIADAHDLELEELKGLVGLTNDQRIN